MFSHEKEGVKSNMTCALKLDTNCKGWSDTMTKILKKIKGLSYNYDKNEGIIYISGKVDSNKIMKLAGKHGKKVELCWINSMEANNYSHVDMPQPMSSSSSYPPYQTGYYPPPPHHHPPMPYYQNYNNYDPMYAPHYDPMYAPQQYGYPPHLPYY